MSRRLTEQDRLWRTVPESQVVQSVMHYVARLGGYCWRNNTGSVVSTYKGKTRYIQYGERGTSDLIAIIPSRNTSIRPGHSLTLFIECKTETGKQSDDQLAWQHGIEQAGGVYLLVRPSNWIEVIDTALKETAV